MRNTKYLDFSSRRVQHSTAEHTVKHAVADAVSSKPLASPVPQTHQRISTNEHESAVKEIIEDTRAEELVTQKVHAPKKITPFKYRKLRLVMSFVTVLVLVSLGVVSGIKAYKNTPSKVPAAPVVSDKFDPFNPTSVMKDIESKLNELNDGTDFDISQFNNKQTGILE